MIRSTLARPRTIVLLLLWALPMLFYVAAGVLALYQTGWFYLIMWTLPPIWLTAWLVGRLWKPPQLETITASEPLRAPTFWTPRDTEAISIVDEFRRQVEDVDEQVIADVNRYLSDAAALAKRLADHYHAGDKDHLLHPLTLVEILTVIHLAAEDLEQWVLTNVPGSDLATVGQLQRIPGYLNKIDLAQKVVFVASSVMNPARLFAYPIWRKSGRVTFELQNELIRAFYQRYLQQLGYYLIEMYSGRLQGGSVHYREKFGHLTAAAHVAGGDAGLLDQLSAVTTTIAIIGQVKAGKSSLINALTKDSLAQTSVLPETRTVTKHQFTLPDSTTDIILLDTPGYSEADVTTQQKKEIRIATQSADIVLLVMAANVSARQADLQAMKVIDDYYREHRQLKPPAVIGVLTHIDLLRPIRQWNPPYDWRRPTHPKEKSIAESVRYSREVFGELVADYACVYTGAVYTADDSVANELIPQLVAHLDHGHSAALLKAFYRQMNQERLKKLAQQVLSLVKSL